MTEEIEISLKMEEKPRMSRGRRYEEPKLNMKKVFAVLLAIVVIVMSVFIIKGILAKDEKTGGNITSKTYFSAYKDNKWGVIDEKGDTVIEPSYEEMIIIPNNKTDIFLCTYDVNYDTGEYQTKALNSKNQEIFTEYSKIEAVPNSDENNNLWYEDNVLKVQKDGKWGTIDNTGKELLKPEYDNIEAMKGIKNALLIQKDGKYGIANNTGSIVLETKYTEITNLGEDDKAGYIVKDDTGLYGIVDYAKNVILPNQYQEIEKVYGNDLYVVSQDGKQKVVNKNGEDVLTDGFEQISAILKTKDQGVIYNTSGKYGVMTLSGEVKIEAQYDNLVEAKANVFIASKDGKQGIIDIDNNEKVAFIYNTISYNETGDIYIAEDESFNSHVMNTNFEIQQTGILIEINTESGYFALRQNDETKYYNFRFEERDKKDILSNHTLYLDKKDNQYGFVDKEGNVVVEYMYDDATEQNAYGYAAVKKDGKWGAINNKGEVIQEPKYDLEDYLMVDFIGKWHLGKDLNMNYYHQ